MFEQASRLKLRFDTPVGRISIEDLWDLPLIVVSDKSNRTSLDSIARDLHTQLKNTEDISFVTKSTKLNDLLQMKFDIVKHIIDIRLAEKEVQEQAKANKERKQKILAIIERKEDNQLESLPLEELKKLVASS